MVTFLAALLPLAAALPPGEAAAVRQWCSARPVSQAALSPDGRRLAWVVPETAGPGSDRKRSAAYIADPGAAPPQRVRVGEGPAAYDVREIAWSPDSGQFACLADPDHPGQVQLYAASAGGGPARRLTSVAGQLARPKWSPDGRTIALLFIENVLHPVGPGLAVPPAAGEVSDEEYRQRILLVDARDGSCRSLTPPDQYVYEFDWSPNGREIAYTAAPAPGDENWWLARLYGADVSGGGVREIFRPGFQIAVPRWSPDGRTIAFIGGLMSDRGSTGGDIWTIPAAGGAPRNRTPGRKSSPGWIEWLPRSGRLLFTEWDHGGTAISCWDPASDRCETLWRGDETIGAGTDQLGLSVAADGETTALIRSSYLQPPEVWSGRIGKWAERTALNSGLKAPWGRAENIAWTDDGVGVEGWLVFPTNYDPQRRYPLIVSVHGGPANQKTSVWPTANSFDFAVMSAAGYFVLCPNPRGSYGQGEAFTAANRKDFGAGDFRDIMAGIDYVLKTETVDPARLGVVGGSYGGFMTMWAITQTRRFRAAVATAGIADWQSYYGQNGIDQWMPPYFGASVYDDPAGYAKSSPIRHILQARTPTLLFVGAGDKICPPPQSIEYWHALKTLGVETQLVVYPGEGHGFRDPGRIADRIARTLVWFDHHLKPASEPPSPLPSSPAP